MAARKETYSYLSGFGNHFSSEAIPDTLPKNQNNPQKCPRGLYAEQLSGTPFTAPRAHNQRSWLYRILPSVIHVPFKQIDNGLITNDFKKCKTTPNQMRWSPLPMCEKPTDFVQGMITFCGAGDPSLKTGATVYLYHANADMKDKAFYNSDGDFLLVPETGTLDIRTEFGCIEVRPGEICVIQRGMLFCVQLPDGNSRGYMVEVFDGHFILPDLGLIGANGLANPRDFLTPVAAYEDRECEYTIVNKFLGNLYATKKPHSPFNIVAWHGNYAPYKYDLENFCTVNTVSYDHIDPSIFTVLSCPTAVYGTACVDFVLFPSRWAVAEHTFRPPYYHRNLMSEFMGLIKGIYDAKEEGFRPGGASLHSCMTPHGPDKDSFEKASNAELKPVKLANTMAIMFESSYVFSLTEYAQNNHLDEKYYQCWQSLEKHFSTVNLQ